MQAWQAGFNGEQPGVTFSYDPVGSGGGREQFLAGGVDFAGSDSALEPTRSSPRPRRAAATGRVFELPNYISAIAVVYNLDGVDELNLSPATIAGIFDGLHHHLERPGDRRGQPGRQAAEHRDHPGAPRRQVGHHEELHRLPEQGRRRRLDRRHGREWPISGGEAANGTSGVVASVRGGQGTIGYADESQAGDLGIAKIKVGDEFVAPSPEAAAAVVANSDKVEGRGEYDLAVAVNRTTTSADEYPIVLVSYHIGCVEYDDQAKADAVKAFESYVISSEGQQAAADTAGSSPITDDARAPAQTVVDAITASAR